MNTRQRRAGGVADAADREALDASKRLRKKSDVARVLKGRGFRPRRKYSKNQSRL